MQIREKGNYGMNKSTIKDQATLFGN